MNRSCRKSRRDLARAPVRPAAALAVALAAGPAWSMGEARPASALRLCAALDHHGAWMIEEQGEAREMADEEVRQAALRLVDARHLCFSGETAAGLAAYAAADPGRPRARWFR